MRLGFRIGPGGMTRSEIDLYADQRELERLRRTVARELATHPGQEALARQIGVSRIVLRRFEQGAVPRPEHVKKIAEWAEDRPPVWTPLGAIILATLVRDLPAAERALARHALARTLAVGFRRADRALPAWLEEELPLTPVCLRPPPAEARAHMDRRDEIEFLRTALRRRVEQTSVRQAATEAGMSHGGVHNFITGTELPYGKTLARLRAWYLEHWAQGTEGLSLEAARYLVAEMLGAIPRTDRTKAGIELLDALEGIHRHHEMPPPAWLMSSVASGATRRALARMHP